MSKKKKDGGNGKSGAKKEELGKTQPDLLTVIYQELVDQSELLEVFGKKLRSLETAISIVMESYTSHNTRITGIENTCESRGKILSKLTMATEITENEDDISR